MGKNANEKATPTPSKVSGCLPQIIANLSMFDYSIDLSKRKGGKKKNPLFDLGQVTITEGVEKTLSTEEITASLSRHICGDWGDSSELGCHINDYSLEHGIALLSEFDTKVQEEEVTYWIITNDKRTATTVLLPEEYW